MARDLNSIFNLTQSPSLSRNVTNSAVSKVLAFDDIGDFSEERQRITRKLAEIQDTAPKVDFSDFSNHVFFDSAVSKFNIAKNKMFNSYPYNGSSEDIDVFRISGSLYENHIADNWPRSQGHAYYATSTPITASDTAGKLYVGTSSLYVSARIAPALPSVTYNILSVLSGSSVGHYYGYTFFATNTSMTFRIMSGAFQYDYVANFVTSSIQNKPTTIAAMYDANAQQISLYLDASKKSVTSVNLTPKLSFGPAVVTVGSSFSGALGEVRVMHTASELYHFKNYNRSVTSEDFVRLNYRFSEDNVGIGAIDSRVIDYSNSGLHGQVVNYQSGFRQTGSLLASDSGTPIVYPMHPAVIAFTGSIESDAELFDATNRSHIMRLIPGDILQDDDDAQDVLISFALAMARYFDELKMYFDQFSNLKTVNNTGVDETPDVMLPVLKKYLGWKVTDHFNDSEPLQFLFGEKVLPSGSLDMPLYDIKNQFWRRILSNLPYLYKTKGKRDNINSFFNVLGINSNIVSLKEFGSVTNSTIQDEYLEKTKPVSFLGLRDGQSVIAPPLSASSNGYTVEVTQQLPYAISASIINDVFTIRQSGSISYVNISYENDNSGSLGTVGLYAGPGDAGLISSAQLPIFNGNLTHFALTIDSNSHPSLAVRQVVDGKMIVKTVISNPAISYPASSGSLNVQFGSSIGFNGTAAGLFGQARVWNRALSDRDLDAHAYNLENVADSYLYASGSALQVQYSFNSGAFIDLSQHNLSGTGVNLSGNQFQSLLVDYSYLSPTFDLKWTQNKIRIRNKTKLSLSDIANDTNQVALEFNLIDALNEDIAKIFSSFDEMNNIIGASINKYRASYDDLEGYRRLYFSKLTDSLHFTRFFKLFKWFDRKLAQSIQQLLPARTNFIGGEFVVDSHMLERNKYQYLYPVFHTPKDINEGRVETSKFSGSAQQVLLNGGVLQSPYVQKIKERERKFANPGSVGVVGNFGIRYQFIGTSQFFYPESVKKPEQEKKPDFGNLTGYSQTGAEGPSWFYQAIFPGAGSSTSDIVSDGICYTRTSALLSPDYVNRVGNPSLTPYFPDYNTFSGKPNVVVSFKLSSSFADTINSLQDSQFSLAIQDNSGQSHGYYTPTHTLNFGVSSSYHVPVGGDAGWYAYSGSFPTFSASLRDLVSNQFTGSYFVNINYVGNFKIWIKDFFVDFDQPLTTAGQTYFYPSYLASGVSTNGRPSSNVLEASISPRFINVNKSDHALPWQNPRNQFPVLSGSKILIQNQDTTGNSIMTVSDDGTITLQNKGTGIWGVGMDIPWPSGSTLGFNYVAYTPVPGEIYTSGQGATNSPYYGIAPTISNNRNVIQLSGTAGAGASGSKYAGNFIGASFGVPGGKTLVLSGFRPIDIRPQNSASFVTYNHDSNAIESSTNSINYKDEYVRRVVDRRWASERGRYIDPKITNGLWDANGFVFANIDSDDSELAYGGTRKFIRLRAMYGNVSGTFQLPPAAYANTYYGHMNTFVTDPNGFMFAPNFFGQEQAYNQYGGNFTNWYTTEPKLGAVLRFKVSGSNNPVNFANVAPLYTDGLLTNWSYYGSTALFKQNPYKPVSGSPGWFQFEYAMNAPLTTAFSLADVIKPDSSSASFGFYVAPSGAVYFVRDAYLEFQQPLSKAGVNYYHRLQNTRDNKYTRYINAEIMGAASTELYSASYYAWTNNYFPNQSTSQEFAQFGISEKMYYVNSAGNFSYSPDFGSTSVARANIAQYSGQQWIIDPLNENNVYLAYTNFASSVFHVLKSVDGGNSFSEVYVYTDPSNAKSSVTDVGCSEDYWFYYLSSGPGIFGRGSGSTFSSTAVSALATGVGIYTDHSINVSRPSHVYVATTANGLYRSIDYGSTFTQVIPNTSISFQYTGRNVVLAPNGYVYAVGNIPNTTTTKVWASPSGNPATFGTVYISPDTIDYAYLAVDASSNVYFGYASGSSFGPAGSGSRPPSFTVYGSYDNGGTWNLIDGQADPTVFSLVSTFSGIPGRKKIVEVGHTYSKVTGGTNSFTRRAFKQTNQQNIGPRSLATSFYYVQSQLTGTLTSNYRLGNVSEFPHYGGLFQMRNLVLGTTDTGKIGNTDDAIVQVRHIGSVVNVMWPDQSLLTAPVPGFGELAIGQSPGNLTTGFTYGTSYDTTSYDHVALYCYALKQSVGTSEDIEIIIQRRPLSSIGFATDQSVEYQSVTATSVARYKDIIHTKTIDYSDLTDTNVSYVIDLPLINVRELRIGVRQKYGQNAGNQNFLVWGRFINSAKET